MSLKDILSLDERFCNNITKDVMKEVKTHLLNASTGAESSAASALKQTDRQTIFLAYGYRADDEEFISGFRDLLADKGWQLLDGKADRLGSVSQAILEKIGLSDCVIIVMTKRDKKENGQFTTAAWLLEEKGAAIALQKRVTMLVEEGVDPSELGGLQGDDQRFPFTRNNFLQVAMNLTRILDRSSD
jgi:hypothetical protein